MNVNELAGVVERLNRLEKLVEGHDFEFDLQLKAEKNLVNFQVDAKNQLEFLSKAQEANGEVQEATDKTLKNHDYRLDVGRELFREMHEALMLVKTLLNNYETRIALLENANAKQA